MDKDLFLKIQGQTNPYPYLIEVESAKGIYIFDKTGKSYMDMISGVAVSNVGHSHPTIIKAIKNQIDKHMHVMVYGEFIQSPQVLLSKAIADFLPDKLKSVYLVNSGAEAIEGAMKLAKRYTGKPEIVYFKNAYHGSTQGALSIIGDEFFKQSFRPLLPACRQLNFNVESDLEQISSSTAAVIIEPIQGEAGYIPAHQKYLQQVRKRCDETGALLVFDEIQSGFGRTGKMFAFEHYQVVPDILVMAKGMGGGMPIGAFVSSLPIMASLSDNPVLGHITTFGGHPVCAAASLACIEVIANENLLAKAELIENFFREQLKHEAILEITGKGAMLALHFKNEEYNFSVIQKCLEKGLITDWFLFSSGSLRISPPLVITDEDMQQAAEIILSCL